MPRRIKNPILLENAEITDILLDGKAVTRHDGQVVFVEGAVPGDICDIHIGAKEKKILFGKVLRITQLSPDRTEPACKHFQFCGGCKWQNLNYEKQLFFKEKYVRDSVQRIGKVEPGEFRPILGMTNPFWYRNKLEFSFSKFRFFTDQEMNAEPKISESESQPALGFHVHGFYNKVLNIDECLLQKPIVNDIRNAVSAFAIQQEIPFYNPKDNVGFLRGLVFRNSEATGEWMLILVVSEEKPEWVDAIFNFVEEKFPQVTSFIQVTNTKINNAYADQPWKTWKGNPFYTEHLGKWKFRISPVSFFQTNIQQAHVLYDLVRDAIGHKRKHIYDLYTGAGSIAIYINDLADKITGIEYSEEAIRDAKQNTELNNLSHLNFFAGDMKKVLNPEFILEHGKPDLVITDPPRAGMDEPVVRRLLEMEPEEIVYVSCNPSTFARDLGLLSEKYELVSVQPVDMFPHTAHVEAVGVLRRR